MGAGETSVRCMLRISLARPNFHSVSESCYTIVVWGGEAGREGEGGKDQQVTFLLTYPTNVATTAFFY